MPGYTFVDAFDLTRVIGPWEVGASVDADPRTGDGSECRVIRTRHFEG